VFNFAGRVVAAVNIAVSTSRWTVEKVREKLMPVTVGVAADISAAMGFPK
jgi:DNA-binding IclR family transcriptional regulator